ICSPGHVGVAGGAAAARGSVVIVAVPPSVVFVASPEVCGVEERIDHDLTGSVHAAARETEGETGERDERAGYLGVVLVGDRRGGAEVSHGRVHEEVTCRGQLPPPPT